MKFEELIEKNIDSLWSAALRLTKNREDAEDLIQETCIKAFENLDSLSHDSKAKGWLFKILTNTFINQYRKEKRSPEKVDIDADRDFLEPIFFKNGQYIDIENEIFANVLDEEIKEAIDCLPLEFRLVVLLVDIEGLSYRDIEEILNISSGTIASRLYRGRRLLRDHLFEYARERGLFGRKKNELS